MLSQFVIYFLIEDYLHYWIHRLLHSKWGYEKIHHVHHEFMAPISHAASYAHWAEILILGFPSFLGPALVPGHVITYWLWFILRQMEAVEIHSGSVTVMTRFSLIYISLNLSTDQFMSDTCVRVDMSFRGVLRSLYHFMEEQSIMIIITLLVVIAEATLHRCSLTAITFMEPIRLVKSSDLFSEFNLPAS